VTLKRSLAVLSVLTAVTVAAAVALSRSEPSPEAGGAAATAVPLPSLFGVVSEGQRLRLARVDSDTLRTRRGTRVGLGSQGCASRSGGMSCWTIPPWSFSPDRSILAVARNDGALARSVRLVDVGRMRVAADIRVTGGAIGLLAWPARERVLALQETCCDERQQLLVVDVATNRVVGRRQLGGTVVRVGRTPRERGLRVAPAQKVGAARLAVVGGRGAVRFLRLDRIVAGERLLDRSEYRFERQLPGLAVDPQGRRAFVAGPDVVADVDLVKLRATYHEPVQSASALARLRDWLDPAAEAKGVRGPTRSARWLGSGLLAVAGADEEWFTDDRGEDQTRIRAAGLSIIDTHDWHMRQADGGASDFRVAGDLLLATGGSWDSATGKQEAIGLAAYGFDGARRFHRFDGREAWIDEIYDGRAYVTVASPKARSKPEGPIIDLVSGRTLGQHPPRLPRLLLDAASSWWDTN
jgi:hypothetical protein